jgi:SH3-like domain-containing protein
VKRIGLALIFFCANVAWGAADVNGDPACAKAYITLRKGPGNQFPVSWKVAKYMPFLKLESKGSWVKVQDLEGETHWAQSRDLSASIHCVVVKTTVATLRTEPSTTAQPTDLKTIDRYTPLKKLDNRAEWIHIEDETGRQAWIHESNVWRPVKIQTMNF